MRKINRQELIEEIQRLASLIGRPPSVEEMDVIGRYSQTPYYREFESWEEAIELSGFEPINSYDISKKSLLDELQRLSSELDRVPTKEDMTSHGKYGHSSYQEEFGSWNNALEEANLSPNLIIGIPSDDLINEIQELSEEIGRKPSKNDMNEFGEYSHNVYCDRFGSWNDSLVKAGFEPGKQPSGENHPLWKGGREPYYGENWRQQREKCRERDNYECQLCGISEEEYVDKQGMKLDVHHIIPRRDFDVVEKSNHIDNLVLLCRGCHRKAEVTENEIVGIKNR